MARPEVADTSAFIRFLRTGRGESILRRGISSERLWLSSVVAAELYAGTRSREEARVLDRIMEGFRRIDRVLDPTARDWVQAGRLLSRRARLAGDFRPRDHLADVLILVSAARLHATVQTHNLRHFKVWEELARDAGLDVVVEGIE